MMRLAIPVLGAAMVVSVASCSESAPQQRVAPAPQGTASESEIRVSTHSQTTKEIVSLGGKRVEFEEAARYGDGLAISVSAPRPFKPSKDVLTAKGEKPVFVTVRVSNGSDDRVRLLGFSLMAESATAQAGDLYDPAAGLGAPPPDVLGPGQKATWRQGFGVQDVEDVLVVVQPEMKRAPVAFTSSKK